jgi:hypothetical protein
MQLYVLTAWGGTKQSERRQSQLLLLLLLLAMVLALMLMGRQNAQQGLQLRGLMVTAAAAAVGEALEVPVVSIGQQRLCRLW